MVCSVVASQAARPTGLCPTCRSEEECWPTCYTCQQPTQGLHETTRHHCCSGSKQTSKQLHNQTHNTVQHQTNQNRRNSGLQRQDTWVFQWLSAPRTCPLRAQCFASMLGTTRQRTGGSLFLASGLRLQSYAAEGQMSHQRLLSRVCRGVCLQLILPSILQK